MKAQRKPRPSPPPWWWYYECCALCGDKNNCSQCKHSRGELKGTDNRRDKRQKERVKDGM